MGTEPFLLILPKPRPLEILSLGAGVQSSTLSLMAAVGEITPIQSKLGEMVGKKGRLEILVRQWLGISTDEVGRMKDSRLPWIENVFPLIDANMTRRDCLRWMREREATRNPRVQPALFVP